MSQAILPLIPDGATPITDKLSVIKKDSRWIYFHGWDPIFSHGEDEIETFRMFTAQLICHGACRNKDILRAFAVSSRSVIRSVKKYRDRADERVLSALGLLQSAPTCFEPCRDVSFGGVLCSLPALACNGLFSHIEDCFKDLKGYYTTIQILILLAYMALCRIKTVEQLRYQPPGELGKLLGLDRIPEVRCLRNKLKILVQDDAPEKWAALLSRDWMDQNPVG